MLDAIAQAAQATGKPIFLSMTPFDGGRSALAPQVTVDSEGSLGTTPVAGGACYDFATAPDAATTQLAYARYVDWMIAEVQRDRIRGGRVRHAVDRRRAGRALRSDPLVVGSRPHRVAADDGVPVHVRPTWCEVLDAFRGDGSDQGLRDYDGNPKPLYTTWQAARAHP